METHIYIDRKKNWFSSPDTSDKQIEPIYFIFKFKHRKQKPNVRIIHLLLQKGLSLIALSCWPSKFLARHDKDNGVNVLLLQQPTTQFYLTQPPTEHYARNRRERDTARHGTTWLSVSIHCWAISANAKGYLIVVCFWVFLLCIKSPLRCVCVCVF